MFKFKWFVFIMLATMIASTAFAMHRTETQGGGEKKVKHHETSPNVGIVLAVFGTSHETALESILNIYNKTREAYPNTPVKMAFTSNVIRKIWQKRSADPAYLKAHPNIPDEVLYVKGVLATIADLQDQGMDYILVQPVHMANGEEYHDLASYVGGLNSIHTMKPKNMPFKKILLGRPVMGTYSLEHEYRDDLEKLAKALACDVEKARKDGRTLVYVAHGNEYMPAGYHIEFEHIMNEMYPDLRTFITMVEGFPGLDVLKDRLLHTKSSKVTVKPLLVVAGDHAKNDMAGDEPNSIKSILEKAGLDVNVEIRGLGSLDGFAQIIVSHISDTAKDAGIVLK